MRYGGLIKRCQVDSLGVLGTRHSYYVLDTAEDAKGSKFSEEMGQRISREILQVIDSSAPLAPRGSEPSAILEEHVAATEQLLRKFKQQQTELKALGMSA